MAHDILALLDELAPQVRAAFIEAITDITSEAQLALIAAHLENRNFEAAILAMNIAPEFFAPLDDALRGVYLRGGVEALAGLPRLKDPLAPGAWWRALMDGTCARKDI